MREIIQEYYSDYLEAFDKHMNERSGHMFNMFIMRYDFFCRYCSWIFNILFSLENKLCKDDRIYGYIGERLLDVWILKNSMLYKDIQILYIEKQRLIKKYINFCIRKISR